VGGIVTRSKLATDIPVSAPLLLTGSHWYTHGFGDGLDQAMAMAADQMLQLLVDRGGFTMDEAYSLASVAVDLGVTQVVDGTVGCHAGIAREFSAGDVSIQVMSRGICLADRLW